LPDKPDEALGTANTLAADDTLLPVPDPDPKPADGPAETEEAEPESKLPPPDLAKLGTKSLEEVNGIYGDKLRLVADADSRWSVLTRNVDVGLRS
jgi:hypothetical protein